MFLNGFLSSFLGFSVLFLGFYLFFLCFSKLFFVFSERAAASTTSDPYVTRSRRSSSHKAGRSRSLRRRSRPRLPKDPAPRHFERCRSAPEAAAARAGRQVVAQAVDARAAPGAGTLAVRRAGEPGTVKQRDAPRSRKETQRSQRREDLGDRTHVTPLRRLTTITENPPECRGPAGASQHIIENPP